jgi:glutathione S-transferase
VTLYLFHGDKHFSSWSMRARVVLAEKRVDHVEREIQLDWPVEFTGRGIVAWTEQTLQAFSPEPAAACRCALSHLTTDPAVGALIADGYAAAIPRVPILVDDDAGAVLTDILAIAEYLEEVGPGRPLLGRDRGTRGEIRSLSAHVHSEYLALHEGMSYAMSFRPQDQGRPTEEAADQARRLLRLMDAVLAQTAARGAGGNFLFGDFSLADVMVAPVAQALTGWGFDLSDRPAVRDYAARLLRRPSVRGHLDEAALPYRRLAEAKPGSVTWIARHYRYREDISMIHNWRSGIGHRLHGEVANMAFQLADEGADMTRIVDEIQDVFDVPEQQLREDMGIFFEQISPLRDGALAAREFTY